MSTSRFMALREELRFAGRIGARYVSSSSRHGLASFMSWLAIGGIALGVALLIIVLSVMNGFEREMRENVLGLVPHLTVSAKDSLSAAQWQTVTQQLNRVDDVEHIDPVVSSLGIAATPRASGAILISGVEAESSVLAKLGDFTVAGSTREIGVSRWTLVMGATLARELGLSVGDSVDLFSPRFIPNPLATKPTFKSFRVVAIVRVGSAEIDDSLVAISKRDARALLRVRSEQTELQLRSTDALGADALAYEIRSLLGSSVQVDTWTTSLGAIYRNIQFSRGIISLMLWLLVAIAAFNLVVSLVMIVREKRSDIGILMTLGAQPRTVLAIFLWQGLAIGLLGILIGSGLGLLGAYHVSDLVAAIESLSGAALLNPEIYPIDFLPSQILLSDVITIACGVSILSLAASLYPARQASRLRPALAIRAD